NGGVAVPAFPGRSCGLRLPVFFRFGRGVSELNLVATLLGIRTSGHPYPDQTRKIRRTPTAVKSRHRHTPLELGVRVAQRLVSRSQYPQFLNTPHSSHCDAGTSSGGHWRESQAPANA